MTCFSISYEHQYLPLPVYEVPAIRVNTTKSTYTFTSVRVVVFTVVVLTEHRALLARMIVKTNLIKVETDSARDSGCL